MKTKQLLLLQLLGLEIIAVIVAIWVFSNYYTDLRYANLSLVASLNMIGVIVGIAAGIVMTFHDQDKNNSKISLLFTGLLIMGILQGFGAIKSIDNTTTLLRSIGYLISSLFFIFIYLSEIEIFFTTIRKWFPLFITISSILFGGWALFFRDALPVIVNNQHFTNAAIAINVTGGVVFIIAACSFLNDFLRSNKLEPYFIATMCILFGLSGLVYFNCSIWDPLWWLANVLRTLAYVIGAGLIVKDYLKIISNVRFVLTEHEKIHEGLMKTKEWFKLIIDTSHEAFISINPKGEIIYWNAQAEKTFGWSEREVLGKRMVDLIIPPDCREAHEKDFNHYLTTGQGPVLDKRIELSALHHDGHIFPIEITIRTIRLGNTITVNAFLHDITERKQIENNLINYQSITETLASSSFTSNEIFSNVLKAICEMAKWEIGEFWEVNKSDNLLRPVEIWHKPSLNIADFIAENNHPLPPGVGVIGKVWSSGNPLWVTDLTKENNSKLIKIAENLGIRGNFAFPVKIANKVVGVINFYGYNVNPPDENLYKLIVNTGIQIGEFINRSKLKENLHTDEERLKAIFDSSADAICFCTLDGVLVDVNDAYTKLTGYSKEDLLSRKKYQDITPPEYHEFEATMVEKVIKTGVSVQFKKEYIKKDNSLVSVLLTVSLVNGSNGKPACLGAVIKDMSGISQHEVKWPLKKVV